MTVTDLRVHAGAYDELLLPDGSARPHARVLVETLRRLGVDELQARQDHADLDILTMGITFTVYSDGRGIDRAWPFDIIPRVIDSVEWKRIEAGLIQRLRALNHFIDDIYNDQRVIADGIFPAELLEGSVNFRPECVGAHPKFGVWAHVSGSDIVRNGDGTVYVLEDNLRVPSGVSYMIENRLIAKRAFADVFEKHSIQPVDGYTDELLELLTSLAPPGQARRRPEQDMQIVHSCFCSCQLLLPAGMNPTESIARLLPSSMLPPALLPPALLPPALLPPALLPSSLPRRSTQLKATRLRNNLDSIIENTIRGDLLATQPQDFTNQLSRIFYHNDF